MLIISVLVIVCIVSTIVLIKSFNTLIVNEDNKSSSRAEGIHAEGNVKLNMYNSQATAISRGGDINTKTTLNIIKTTVWKLVVPFSITIISVSALINIFIFKIIKIK